MNVLVHAKREELAAVCAQRGVRRLELFGSATDERFNSSTSDLDFLVEFEEVPPGGLFDAYFGLLEDLEQLFGRRVDLVMTRAIRNPYFLEAVNQSRQVVYAA